MEMKVTRPFYDFGGRKYIELDHKRFKVPWRYNRVMCHIEGIRPLQSIQLGEVVYATFVKKSWEGDIFWVLDSIRPIQTQTDSVQSGVE